MTARSPLQVLVVDDSAYNRQTLTTLVEELPDVEVVGRAGNGKEALRLVYELEPDVITLDLEMPEMDGFAFLRLLMNSRPTPVLVVSGYSAHDNVFRALELGALDFIHKPSRSITPELKSIAAELQEKIQVVRRLAAVRLRDRARNLAKHKTAARKARVSDTSAAPSKPAQGLVAIGASTGGPPALQQLLMQLPAGLPVAMVIAQHMPARFTRTFADRLDQLLPFRVTEAKSGDELKAGCIMIAPGGQEVSVVTSDRGPILDVHEPRDPSGIAPSADHLFTSAAGVFGEKLCAVVLTGMGADGTRGSGQVQKAGGRVLIEDPDTAVMPGMPGSVMTAGTYDDSLPLDELAGALVGFAEACRSGGKPK